MKVSKKFKVHCYERLAAIADALGHYVLPVIADDSVPEKVRKKLAESAFAYFSMISNWHLMLESEGFNPHEFLEQQKSLEFEISKMGNDLENILKEEA